MERPLTPREVQIMKGIRLGHSNEKIAQVVELSPATVKTHISRILRVTKTTSRAAAVAWCYDHGYFVPNGK